LRIHCAQQTNDERGNATALIVDGDGVVQIRKLTVAQTVGTNWLVKHGIDPGDRVIVEGLQYARAGQKANAVAFVARDDKAAPVAATPAEGSK